MKKVSLIFLICIYSLATMGFSLKEFYCCGKLKSITFSLALDTKQKCGKGDGSGCCDNKYQSFKIKDAHAAADILAAPALPFSFVHTLNSIFQINELVYENNIRFVNIHAPPLHSTTPVYISNCVFRI